MQLVDRINNNKYSKLAATIVTFVTISGWFGRVYKVNFEMDNQLIIDGVVAFATTGLLLAMLRVVRELYKKMIVFDAMAQVRSREAFMNSVEAISFGKKELEELYKLHLEKDRSALFFQIQNKNESLSPEKINKLIEEYNKSMVLR